MNEADETAARVSSVLHDFRVTPTQSAQDTSRAAQAIGGRLRTRRRRIVVAGAASVVTLAAAGVMVGLLRPGSPPSDTSATLPADQPVCPASLPVGARPGGLLAGSSPFPRLATSCDYNPKTKGLHDTTGQIRPVDIPDFLTFVRSLTPAKENDCAGGSPTDATSIQFLLEDETIRSLTVASTTRCATLSDGSTEITVAIASLNGTWADTIDTALQFPSAPVVSIQGPVYITPTADAPPTG